MMVLDHATFPVVKWEHCFSSAERFASICFVMPGLERLLSLLASAQRSLDVAAVAPELHLRSPPGGS